MGKLINRIPGSHLLISSLPGLGFDNACRIARQASRCQQAFSKPCLVNLISKDTHLEVSYFLHHKQTTNKGITIYTGFGLHQQCPVLQKMVTFRHFLRPHSDVPVLFEEVLIFNGF